MLWLLRVNLFQQKLNKTKPNACNPPSPCRVPALSQQCHFLGLGSTLILPAWGLFGLSFAMALAV